MSRSDAHWIFGYGSLIWRPDFEFLEAQPAILSGYVRRFWQGSHDHRGLPERPGRVVTLIPAPDETCIGMAYLIEGDVVHETFEQLDHREKNGYQRVLTNLQLRDGRCVDGLVYVAPTDNFAYLGEASLPAIAQQIASSEGPSGHNVEYLVALAQALRKLDADDAHVFELESLVLSIMD